DPPSRLTALRWASRIALVRRSSRRERGRDPRQTSLPVVIGAGSHPFPFRTRKLSLLPPMVLCGKLHGRVGRCRHYSRKARAVSGFSLFSAAMRSIRQQFPTVTIGGEAAASRVSGEPQEKSLCGKYAWE